MRFKIREFFRGVLNLIDGDPWQYDEFDHGYREGIKVVQQDMQALSDKQIDDACISCRHDFGLLNSNDQESLRRDCQEWARALTKQV